MFPEIRVDGLYSSFDSPSDASKVVGATGGTSPFLIISNESVNYAFSFFKCYRSSLRVFLSLSRDFTLLVTLKLCWEKWMRDCWSSCLVRESRKGWLMRGLMLC